MMTTNATDWRILLTGELAEAAQQAVQAIAHALQPAAIDNTNLSLGDGAVGIALFYAYLAQITENETHTAAALQYLNQAVEGIATTPLPHSLYSGVAGLAWTLLHLQGRLLEADPDLVDATIDVTLLAAVSQAPWPYDYDLISGLLGLGVYFIERLPAPSAVAGLTHLVTRLQEHAITQPDGITWWTDPCWLSAEGRAQLPTGCYDLGIAHGIAGVIALLSHLCALDCATAQARPLLDGAVAWLLAQQLPATAPSRFPTWVQPDGARPPSRLAWCYGDLGIAVALLRAARLVKEPVWEAAACDLAQATAQRAQAQEDVQDTGLCHGFASIAHLFNRLYQATGDERFAEVARLWFTRTLAQRHPHQGIAGFLALAPTSTTKLEWVADPGLLTGVAGIGLALLAALYPLPPAWDQLMLIAIPSTPTSPTA